MHIVNTSEDSKLNVHRQLDGERERNSRLFAENQQLEKKIEQLKQELRLERKNNFATNKQKANVTAVEKRSPVQKVPLTRTKRMGRELNSSVADRSVDLTF